MTETQLGQVTVADSSQHQASGSGARDGSRIDVRLGRHDWIKKGGNYTLTAGANHWKTMNTDGPDASGYYSFEIY